MITFIQAAALLVLMHWPILLPALVILLVIVAAWSYHRGPTNQQRLEAVETHNKNMRDELAYMRAKLADMRAEHAATVMIVRDLQKRLGKGC